MKSLLKFILVLGLVVLVEQAAGWTSLKLIKTDIINEFAPDHLVNENFRGGNEKPDCKG